MQKAVKRRGRKKSGCKGEKGEAEGGVGAKGARLCYKRNSARQRKTQELQQTREAKPPQPQLQLQPKLNSYNKTARQLSAQCQAIHMHKQRMCVCVCSYVTLCRALSDRKSHV